MICDPAPAKRVKFWELVFVSALLLAMAFALAILSFQGTEDQEEGPPLEVSQAHVAYDGKVHRGYTLSFEVTAVEPEERRIQWKRVSVRLVLEDEERPIDLGKVKPYSGTPTFNINAWYEKGGNDMNVVQVGDVISVTGLLVPPKGTIEVWRGGDAELLVSIPGSPVLASLSMENFITREVDGVTLHNLTLEVGELVSGEHLYTATRVTLRLQTREGECPGPDLKWGGSWAPGNTSVHFHYTCSEFYYNPITMHPAYAVSSGDTVLVANLPEAYLGGWMLLLYDDATMASFSIPEELAP